VSHENKVVSSMILRFPRRLIGHASGLSGFEWSPFRPVESRRIELMLGPSSSNIFCCKKRAFNHLQAQGEISHRFVRGHQENFYTQGEWL